MATTQTVILDVNTNLDEATKKVGSLKSELRKAQQEVAELSNKFGATSKEAVEAAKRASELKDRIGDAKALTDAFNPDAKFKALTASLSGVAGGFSAVQGAIGLAGAESADLEKAMLKVQSAMALSQGVQALGESVDSFKQLKAVIVESSIAQKAFAGATALAGTVQKAFTGAVATTSTGFKVLRGAIISTGIGALVVGVGLLITNFDKVKQVVLNLVPGLEKAGEFIMGIVNAVTDFVGATSEAGRELEKLNTSTSKMLANNQRDLELNGDKYDEYTKRKKQIDIDYLTKKGEILKDETILEEDKQNLIAQYRESARRKLAQVDKDEQDAKDKANLEQEKKDEEAEAKRKANAQKIIHAKKEEAKKLRELEYELNSIVDADIKKAKENEAQAMEANRLAQLDQYDREIELIKAKYVDKFALAEQAGESSKEILAQQNAEIEELTFAHLEKLSQESLDRQNKDIENEKIVAQAKKEIQQQGIDNVSSGLNSLKQLAGENKQIQKGILIAESAIGIAKISQNTQTAVAKANALSPETFGLPWSGVAIASGVLGVAANIQATSKALSALGGGSAPSGGNVGGAGVGSPTTPNFNVVGNSGVNQLANQIGKRENTPIKAFVVAQEVETANGFNRNIIKNATIGG